MANPIPWVKSARASAPGRICLAGEGLDWMVRGQSVVAAIDLRTTVSFDPAGDDGKIHLVSGEPVFASRSVLRIDARKYRGDILDLLQAAAYQVLKRSPRYISGTFHVSSALPVGVGLSSSAALTLATCAALSQALDLPVDRSQVCRDAFRAENHELGIGSGWMDFLGCAYGGVSQVSSAVDPSCERLRNDLDAVVVIAVTDERRPLRETLAALRARLRQGDPDLLTYITETQHVVDQLSLELRKPVMSLDSIGDLVRKAHCLLRDRLHCATPLIDRAIGACTSAGAYAAKQVGDRGASLFAICPEYLASEVLAALNQLNIQARVVRVDTNGLIGMDGSFAAEEPGTCG